MPTRDRLRLIVFDWDGTLIDSIGAIVDCSYAMLDELGLPRISRTEVLSMIGAGLGDAISILAPEADEATRQQVVETYRRLWFGEYHDRSTLIEGARSVVEEFRESGMLVAVATAKSRRGLTLDFERTGLGVAEDA